VHPAAEQCRQAPQPNGGRHHPRSPQVDRDAGDLLGRGSDDRRPSPQRLAHQGASWHDADAWHERKPMVSHLHIFGCLAFAKELTHVGKLDDRSTTRVFIGYVEGTKAYHILDPTTQRVRIS